MSPHILWAPVKQRCLQFPLVRNPRWYIISPTWAHRESAFCLELDSCYQGWQFDFNPQESEKAITAESKALTLAGHQTGSLLGSACRRGKEGRLYEMENFRSNRKDTCIMDRVPWERAGYVPRPRDNIEEKKKIKAAIKSHNTDYRAGRWFLLFH